MPAPKQSTHLDRALSDFAVAYSQEGMFIAGQAMPVKKVKKESDKYFTYQRKDILTIPMKTLRANGAESMRNFWDVSSSTYQCEEYSLHDFITQRDRRNADSPIEPEQDSVRILTEKLLLDREYRVASLMFDTSSTFSSYTAALSGGDQWDDYENSNPFAKIEDAKKSVRQNALKVPNVIIMGDDVYIKLIHHPDIKERIMYGGGPSNPAMINESNIAKLFDIPKVLIGRAVYNAANYNDTETVSNIWGKYFGVYYIDPNPSTKTVTAGVTFRAQDWQVRKWWDDDHNGDKVEISYIDDEVVPVAAAGYIYSTVVS